MNPLLGGVGVGSCTEHRAQGTEHRAQGTGHRAQGTGHRAQGTGEKNGAPRTSFLCLRSFSYSIL